MLTEQHYQVLWIYYGLSGLFLLVLFWYALRGFKRFYLRYVFIIVLAIAIFMPWQVAGTSQYLAPGIASLIMSLIG